MSKTSATYWRGKVFRPTYTDGDGKAREASNWCLQLKFGGVRKKVSLPSPDRLEAARKAADFYRELVRGGWDHALAWLRPGEAVTAKTVGGATVGAWVQMVEDLRVLGERTAAGYGYGLRWIARAVAGGESTPGSRRWRDDVDSVPLFELTTPRVQRAIDAYVHDNGANPLESNRAAVNARSYLRNGRALFSKAILKRATLPIPDPLPFRDVELPPVRSPRYVATVEPGEILSAAREELREAEPPVWVAFLLAFGAGLRRAELCALTWPQVRWERATIWIRADANFDTKTEGSEDEIFVDESLLSELRAWRSNALAPGDYVLPGRATPPKPGHGWRCDEVLDRLSVWLRGHGVTSDKPIHELRKLFGSHVAQFADIFTAQRQLRHAQISTTANYYVENRRRIAPSVMPVTLGNVAKTDVA